MNADEVQERLPDGWEAQDDGVISVFPVDEKGIPFPPEKAPASFGLKPDDGELWRAVDSRPSEKRGGYHDLHDSTTGAAERCAEWVAERAEEVDPR